MQFRAIADFAMKAMIMLVKIVLCLLALLVLLIGILVFYWEVLRWHKGNFTVELTDIDGDPVTNAIVTVKATKGGIWGYGCDSEYNFFRVKSDASGVASVDFKCCANHFQWDIASPTHYGRLNPGCFEEFDGPGDDKPTAGISSPIHTRTKSSVPSVRRKVVLYPKRNPQPMYAYGADDWPELPMDETVVKTNGYSLVVPPVVGFDLKNMKLVDANDQDADFRFERYYIETNGVNHFYGRIVFAPGCGAYRCKKTGDESFPTTYMADENSRYEQSFEFFNIDDACTGKVLSRHQLIEKDEYLVLRTRMSITHDRITNGWHYSKLVGPCRICGNLTFAQSVFNPQLNDCNLEFDLVHNLANPEFRVMCP